MSIAAEDFEAIRRRLEEIEAEKKQALTGSSAPVTNQAAQTDWYNMSGIYDYTANGLNQ